MEFKEAVEGLCSPITHQQLADALGVSRASVRQAMLPEGANARRKAPEGWQATVADLAGKHASRLQRLAKGLNNASAK